MSLAKDIHERFKSGEKSASAIVEDHLQKIGSSDTKVGAFLELFSERALVKAKELDQKRKDGKKLGKLAGVPVALKDNILVKGQKLTCASKILTNYVGTHDATVTRLLEEEDAIIIGRTNQDEFAMGSSTEYSAYQKTGNPWNLTHTPGGSSGGSAAAVSARMVPLSLGSDTGGSIRQPASFTGTVGYKPTYGRISRHGLVAFGSSLDCIGPFANSVEDIALCMEVLARHCHFDSTSLRKEQEHFVDLLKEGDIHGKKIGIPFSFLEGQSEQIASNFAQSIEKMKEQGAEIVDIDLSIMKYGIPIYYILATAEASTNLSRFDGIRYGMRAQAKSLEDLYDITREQGFGPEVKKRILLGTFVLSSGFQDAFYRKALKVRTLIVQAFKEAFKACDIIAMPTTPTTSFEMGSIQDGLSMYKQDLFTVTANLAGLPAISLPSGLSKKGLPLSLQLIGPQQEDARVLRFASCLESPLAPPPGFAS